MIYSRAKHKFNGIGAKYIFIYILLMLKETKKKTFAKKINLLLYIHECTYVTIIY